MQIKGILETALYVDNLKLAEDFYTRILGLKLNSKKEGRHVFLKCGNNILLLFNPEESLKESGLTPVHGTKGPGHIAFEIEENEFEDWKQHLKNNNINIEKEVNWPEGGRSIYFRDPSGNSLEFTILLTWGLK